MTVQDVEKPPYAFAVVRRQRGSSKRETEYFREKGVALARAEAWAVEAGNVGAQAASTLTASLKRDVMNWRLQLEPFGKGIGDAVAYYIEHLKKTRTSLPLAEVAEKLVAAKQKEGMALRYVNSLRNCYARFGETFGERLMSEITHDEVETWMDSLGVSKLTFNNLKRDLTILWRYALKQRKGWVDENVIAQIQTRKETQKEKEEKKITFLTLERARGLLQVAENDMLPYYALGLFAGLRDSELQRLDWRAVSLQTSYIKVGAHVALKTGERLVPISENLAAWLRPFVKAGGPVAPKNCDERKKQTKRAFERAGFAPLENNVLRHSFGTYRMAQTKDIGLVSEEMGNTPNMIKNHYKAAVPYELGDQFFSISPGEGATANIIPMRAAA